MPLRLMYEARKMGGGGGPSKLRKVPSPVRFRVRRKQSKQPNMQASKQTSVTSATSNKQPKRQKDRIRPCSFQKINHGSRKKKDRTQGARHDKAPRARQERSSPHAPCVWVARCGCCRWAIAACWWPLRSSRGGAEFARAACAAGTREEGAGRGCSAVAGSQGRRNGMTPRKTISELVSFEGIRFIRKVIRYLSHQQV